MGQMDTLSHSQPPISEEFQAADLGDNRLNKRLIRMAEAAEAAPSSSLPRRAKNPTELTGFYRFLRNSKVTPEKTLEPHVLRTVDRAEEVGRVLVIHDTTEFEFGGEQLREGLGPLSSEHRQGFFAHYSICSTLAGEPLGTLAMRAWRRVGAPKGRSKHTSRMAQYDPDREYLRWQELALEAGERTFGKAEAIHVMDREGDCYELFSMLAEHDQSFVIRMQHNRRLCPGRESAAQNLFESLKNEPITLERDVPLSRRGKKGRRTKEQRRFPPRDTRLAHLEVRAGTRQIFIGNGAPAHLPSSLVLNFVDISEAAPLQGEDPICWHLVTNLPIDTTDQIAEIVDSYCRRWLIEEFFKVVKTGCGFQTRQLETAQHLLIDLSIETAVAWRLLRLRWLSRKAPEAPALSVINSEELLVLQALARQKKRPLPPMPTVKDVLFEIAAQGGHLKNNGNPGWLVLRYGYEKLSIAVELWKAIHAEKEETQDTGKDKIYD